MLPALETPAAKAHGVVPSPATLAALADNMHSEARLLNELAALMRRQRDAVGADDLQGVDDSVFATQRVLLTLNEARRRRRALNQLIGEGESLGLRALEGALGAMMTDDLRAARDGLQGAALALSQEVEINRRVLRAAMATNDEYVRTLYGGPEAKPLYGADATAQGEPRSGGLLLNRHA